MHEGPSSPSSVSIGPRSSAAESEGGAAGRGCSSASYEHFGESVCPGAGDVAFRRVERHVVDGLLELLPVGGELLDAGFTLQVPQADGGVVAWREEEGREPLIMTDRNVSEVRVWETRYLLPDIRYSPLGSTAKLVTASRWATMEWISFPLVLSKNLMCRSSCAVMVMGRVG